MYFNPWIMGENNWGYADGFVNGWQGFNPHFIDGAVSPLIFRGPRFRRVFPRRFFRHRRFW
jgi:hypothetical protein